MSIRPYLCVLGALISNAHVYFHVCLCTIKDLCNYDGEGLIKFIHVCVFKSGSLMSLHTVWSMRTNYPLFVAHGNKATQVYVASMAVYSKWLLPQPGSLGPRPSPGQAWN